MQYINIRASIIFFTIMFTPLLAQASIFADLDYYAGTSIGYQNLAYKQGYGQGFFPNDAAIFEMYTGRQRCNRFGFEFGFTASTHNNQYVRLNPGDKYPGSSVPLNPGTYQVWDAHINTETFYGGINRYYGFNSTESFRAFVFAGVAWANVNAYVDFIDDDLPGFPSSLDVSNAYRSFSKSALIPMLKLGLEYDFAENFGCRLNYTWTNYATMSGIKSEQYPNRSSEVKLGNANAIYLGVYFIT